MGMPGESERLSARREGHAQQGRTETRVAARTAVPACDKVEHLLARALEDAQGEVSTGTPVPKAHTCPQEKVEHLLARALEELGLASTMVQADVAHARTESGGEMGEGVLAESTTVAMWPWATLRSA